MKYYTQTQCHAIQSQTPLPLYSIGNLGLVHFGMLESVHKCLPGVSSPPPHLVLPLQPCSQHIIQEEEGVPDRLQSGDGQPQHQAQTEDLLFAEGQEVRADIYQVL